jgi:hypothetical protein
VTLVPNVDDDGNEIAGIRLPDVSVPLGTYMGWNPRRAEFGAPDYVGRWAGSFLRFAATEEERQRTGDPRPSIEERYPTHRAYIDRVVDEVRKLQEQGFLLEEDAKLYVEKAKKMTWPPPDAAE